jgi:hypothetical protein
MDDLHRAIDRKTLADQGKEKNLRNTTVEERWKMMRQLTIDEWAKKGIDITKLSMRKDVERLIRLTDK